MTKRRAEGGGLVYSTDRGRLCPGCGHPAGSCRCGKKSGPAGDGIVRISRETKGRKGSGVSLISGLPLDEDGLKKLASQLKQKCGTGGSIKNGVIEIQGDHRELLKTELARQGYQVKLAGG
jgi:translation initiation factor 1